MLVTFPFRIDSTQAERNLGPYLEYRNLTEIKGRKRAGPQIDVPGTLLSYSLLISLPRTVDVSVKQVKILTEILSCRLSRANSWQGPSPSRRSHLARRRTRACTLTAEGGASPLSVVMDTFAEDLAESVERTNALRCATLSKQHKNSSLLSLSWRM